jgi:hypothetical protein
LYALSTKDLPLADEFFPAHVWTLLTRYHAFFGPERFEGQSLQAAVPARGFQLLSSTLGVSFEAFASPLNCYYPRFCSAFADTDWVFGSQGSFFSQTFCPLAGSFEANPPFTVEAMELLARRADALLRAATGPMSFFIVLPYWMHPPAEGIVLLQRSPYLRLQKVVPAQAVSFVSGGQHLAATADSALSFPAAHESVVFLLQNEAGSKRWPCDASSLAAVVAAMRS